MKNTWLGLSIPALLQVSVALIPSALDCKQEIMIVTLIMSVEKNQFDKDWLLLAEVTSDIPCLL